MIEQLRAAFPDGYPRQPRRLWKAIAALGRMLGAEGKFNFLLADGRHLYARCGTKLCYIVRKAPFGRATLRDAEMQIDFSAVTTARDRVAVVATEPLTRDEAMQKVMGSVLPAVFLSGYIFPVESMPGVLRPIANLIPTTWMIDGGSPERSRSRFVWSSRAPHSTWPRQLFSFPRRASRTHMESSPELSPL
jgi:hypothetical protein